MRSEDEKRLILLSAILQLGGSGSKDEVLNEIANLNMMKLSTKDLEILHTRKELKWRNNIAFVRSSLVRSRCLSAEVRDTWCITDRGKVRYDELVRQAFEARTLRYITTSAMELFRNSLIIDVSDDNALTKETGVEGGEVKVWKTRYERDPKLRAAAIEHHGIVCMGCGFNFEATYGSIGAGFIEVHHTQPVSTLGRPTEVDPERDLIVLCSNCHSMVHRKRQTPLSLIELRKALGRMMQE